MQYNSDIGLCNRAIAHSIVIHRIWMQSFIYLKCRAIAISVAAGFTNHNCLKSIIS